MNSVRSLFPGAMGPEGFISCFDHLADESSLRKMIILKGGPGVGKSTFMRRIHAALCADGESATLYFCSGDPDSLDAVAIPHAGLLVLDGTAPHMIDPKIPGARDSIVNLGDCLNEAAMRPKLPHIRACMKDHAICTRRVSACLKAISAALRDNAAILRAATDEEKLARLTRSVIQSALIDSAPRDCRPSVRPVITDAITRKGELCLLAEGAQQRVIRIALQEGMDATPLLRAVSHAALAAGYSVEEHLNVLMPGSLMHVGIPSLGTLITTSASLPSEQTFDLNVCLPQSSLLRHECMLEQGRAAVRRGIRQAVSALVQAGQLHDELETFYVPCMDFSLWQEKFDALLSSL